MSQEEQTDLPDVPDESQGETAPLTTSEIVHRLVECGDCD